MAGKRPKGRYVAIHAGWQRRVADELEARGWTQKRLAKELHCSPGAVTGMLAEGAGSSRLVDATCVLLRVAPPEYDDDIDQRNHEMLRRLRRENRSAYDREVQRIERALAETANDNDQDHEDS